MMRNEISALMDSELEDDIAERTLGHLKHEEYRVDWATYHLIGDALRQPDFLCCDLAEKVKKQLELEPTILAPQAIAKRSPQESKENKQNKARVFALSAAASVAAVAVVGWMALQTMERVPDHPTLAKATTSDYGRSPVMGEARYPVESTGQIPAAFSSPAVTAASSSQQLAAAKQTVETYAPAHVQTLNSMQALTPAGMNDYLLAHQEFSPSTAMQGVAPYVRTVADVRQGAGR